MSIVREVQIADKKIRFEFQKFAKQANGSVMITCGETQILVTVTAANEPREGQSFFPLTVDYIEKHYAAGRIPGGFLKRETKPSDLETLTARVTDRPLRPCFPENYMCDTHVVCTVLSFDGENHPAPLACIGASCCLMISDIPFDGPVASLQVGLKDGEFIIGPTVGTESDLELTVSAKPDAILMVEAGANFLSEDQMIEAILTAHKAMEPLFEMQRQLQSEIGVPKRALPEADRDEALASRVQEVALPKAKEAFATRVKQDRSKALRELSKYVHAELNPDGDSGVGEKVSEYLEELKYNYMRGLILNDKNRIDGRNFDDIRALECEVGLIYRTHGSALFQRGETQALATVTLGAGEDEQMIDSVVHKFHKKKFMLHYNFPPFSVGEARPLRGPGRREVGHGNLAERALSKALPDSKEFGYTIRLVSEVLESNGSSSMATVCAGTMALLNAGVPISKPIAGIAMGLVKEGESYEILTDILGDEDHLGDMDFKVCGSRDGITALQMDIKTSGISRAILEEALTKAKNARMSILDKIEATIAEPQDISEHAPRIFQIKVKEDKVRDLIGPGGKMIKRIVAETGVRIDIEDNGVVNIVSPDVTSSEAAKQMIRSVTTDPEPGEIYLGTVKRIVDFGAFVEIKPGVEGLCHISQIENKRIDKVSDYLKEGEECLVKVLEIDHQGRLKLSRKEALGRKPTVQE